MLVECIDAESGQLRNFEGEVCFKELLVGLALLVIHDVVHHAVHFFVRQGRHIDPLDVPIDANHGRHACR